MEKDRPGALALYRLFKKIYGNVRKIISKSSGGKSKFSKGDFARLLLSIAADAQDVSKTANNILGNIKFDPN